MSKTLNTVPVSNADIRTTEISKECASVNAVMAATSGAAKAFQDDVRRRAEDERDRVRYQYD